MKLTRLSAFEEFLRGITAKSTKTGYSRRLKVFLEWVASQPQLRFKTSGKLERAPGRTFTASDVPNLAATADRFADRAKADLNWAYVCVSRFLDHQSAVVGTYPKEQQPSKANTLVAQYRKPLVKFYEMGDIIVNWKRVNVGLPKGRSFADDKKIELKQIQDLLKFDDSNRTKVITLLLSHGVDVGAFAVLRKKHIKPIIENGKVVAAELRTFRDKTDTWYDTFVTAETYSAVDDYFASRKKWNENLTDESPLVRNLFYPERRASGVGPEPRVISKDQAVDVIETALNGSGVRIKGLPEGKTRYPFQTTKAFRKFFTTMLDEAHVPDKFAAVLRGDKTGFRMGSYHRPSDRDEVTPYFSTKELLGYFLKAAPLLTITTEARKDLNFEKTVEERLREEKKVSDGEVASLRSEVTQLKEQMKDVAGFVLDATPEELVDFRERQLENRMREARQADIQYETENSEVIAEKAQERARMTPAEKNSERLELNMTRRLAKRRKASEGVTPE